MGVNTVPAPRCDTCPWWDCKGMKNAVNGLCHNAASMVDKDSAEWSGAEWWCSEHPCADAFIRAGGYLQFNAGKEKDNGKAERHEGWKGN